MLFIKGQLTLVYLIGLLSRVNLGEMITSLLKIDFFLIGRIQSCYCFTESSCSILKIYVYQASVQNPVLTNIWNIFDFDNKSVWLHELCSTEHRCPWRCYRYQSGSGGSFFLAVNTKMHISEQKFNILKCKAMRLDKCYRLVSKVLVLNSNW
jgi:hypothetical protein